MSAHPSNAPEPTWRGTPLAPRRHSWDWVLGKPLTSQSLAFLRGVNLLVEITLQNGEADAFSGRRKRLKEIKNPARLTLQILS